MRRIHITESQLIELAKKRMNEDAPLGATQTTQTTQGQTNSTQPQQTTNGQTKTVSTPEGSITTDNATKMTTVSLNHELTNGAAAKTEARGLLQKNEIPFDPKKTNITDNSNGIPTPVRNNTTNPEMDTKSLEHGYGIGNKLKPMEPLAENFITKADIKKARLDRLVSESVPFKKSELFGIVAESDEMYNFKFKDGETYKMQGNKVDDFRKYVFEQDGSLEGREYIIEKIEH